MAGATAGQLALFEGLAMMSHRAAGRIAVACLVAIPVGIVSTTNAAAAQSTGSTHAASAAGAPSSLPVWDGFIHENGIRLHVHSVGSAGGDTIVLVHGGPGLTLQTLAAFDALANRHRRVVSYDQRGAGESSMSANHDYSLAAQLGDLDAVREWAHAGKVAVVGHSWGGILAAAYTAENPNRVSSLVLLDPVPLGWSALVAGFARRNARVTTLQQQGLIPNPLPPVTHNSCLALVKALTPAYLADPRAPIPPAVLWGPSCTASTSTFSVNAVFFERHMLPILASQLGQWRGRALVVEGDRDPFGLAWLRFAVAHLGDTTFLQQLVVPFAGHFPWAERPTLVLQTVDRFLE